MLVDQLAQTMAFLRTKTSIKPSVGIVLGSGLGSLAESLEELS